MVSSHNSANPYLFGAWRYEPESRRLCGPEGSVRLKPLLDRLLRRLLDEPGAVLSRERLIEQVWTRRGVNDEVLSRAIAELRGLLADDARDPGLIETLPKGGYRWIAPVTRVTFEASDGSVQGPPHTVAPTSLQKHRVALVIGIASLLCALVIGLAWSLSGEHEPVRAALAVDLLGARPLASDPRYEFDPRFDPAGHVAYIRADPQTRVSELIVVDPATRAERVLWQDAMPLRHPTPSPNGREVALTRFAEHGCEVWSVAVVDSHRTRLGDCAAAVGGMEWVGDGSALLYTGTPADAMHAAGLVLLDRRSGHREILTTPDSSEGAHVDPRLSADGRTLVYTSRRDDEGQMWKTAWPLGRSREALLKRLEPVYGHAFEPTGDALWVAGDLTSYRALHRLRHGSEPELIGGRGAQSIDLAADGAAVWSEARYDADIWLKRDAKAAWVVVARSNRYETQPEFSADGTMLALVSNRGGTESVFLYDLVDGSTRALTLIPEYRWVRPTWSPRDQSLILTAYEDRHTRLYRYRPDGNILTRIPNIAEGAFQGIELADRLLYIAGHGTPTATLMQQRAGESHSEDLGLGAVTAYRASADWIAWRSPDSPNLHVAPLPALQPIREVVRVDEDATEAFTLSGNTLLFLDQGKLWSLKLAAGVATEMTLDHLPDGSGPNIAVSGNGALATVTLSSLNMDLMIADPTRAKP